MLNERFPCYNEHLSDNGCELSFNDVKTMVLQAEFYIDQLPQPALVNNKDIVIFINRIISAKSRILLIEKLFESENEHGSLDSERSYLYNDAVHINELLCRNIFNVDLYNQTMIASASSLLKAQQRTGKELIELQPLVSQLMHTPYTYDVRDLQSYKTAFHLRAYLDTLDKSAPNSDLMVGATIGATASLFFTTLIFLATRMPIVKNVGKAISTLASSSKFRLFSIKADETTQEEVAHLVEPGPTVELTIRSRRSAPPHC